MLAVITKHVYFASNDVRSGSTFRVRFNKIVSLQHRQMDGGVGAIYFRRDTASAKPEAFAVEWPDTVHGIMVEVSNRLEKERSGRFRRMTNREMRTPSRQSGGIAAV